MGLGSSVVVLWFLMHLAEVRGYQDSAITTSSKLSSLTPPPRLLRGVLALSSDITLNSRRQLFGVAWV